MAIVRVRVVWCSEEKFQAGGKGKKTVAEVIQAPGQDLDEAVRQEAERKGMHLFSWEERKAL